MKISAIEALRAMVGGLVVTVKPRGFLIGWTSSYDSISGRFNFQNWSTFLDRGTTYELAEKPDPLKEAAKEIATAIDSVVRGPGDIESALLKFAEAIRAKD